MMRKEKRLEIIRKAFKGDKHKSCLGSIFIICRRRLRLRISGLLLQKKLRITYSNLNRTIYEKVLNLNLFSDCILKI